MALACGGKRTPPLPARTQWQPCNPTTKRADGGPGLRAVTAATTAVAARRKREGGGEGRKHSVLLGTTNGLPQRQQAVRNQRPGKQMGNI